MRNVVRGLQIARTASKYPLALTTPCPILKPPKCNIISDASTATPRRFSCILTSDLWKLGVSRCYSTGPRTDLEHDTHSNALGQVEDQNERLDKLAEELKSARLQSIGDAAKHISQSATDLHVKGAPIVSAAPTSQSHIATPESHLNSDKATLPKPAISTLEPTETPEIEDKSLPSQTAKGRSAFATRFHERMEHLLHSLSVAGQRVNVLTGTDYTGIEALRHAIIKLEKRMMERHEAVNVAKQTQSAAVVAQSTSQKEVVQLLERKHSWTATDLERYMALIRSEHVNEQAVQNARDGMISAERALEETRAALEKYERRQYHEEQVWSDTIRRNSTWVTIALMGANILLLLANLVIFEPWRRQRLVREVKQALDDNNLQLSGSSSLATSLGLSPPDLQLNPNEPRAAVGQNPPHERLAPALLPEKNDWNSTASTGSDSLSSLSILDNRKPTSGGWHYAWDIVSRRLLYWQLLLSEILRESDSPVTLQQRDLLAAAGVGAAGTVASAGLVWLAVALFQR